MNCSRLLIVSNRLPVIARVVDGAMYLSDAGGGLATGLRLYRENSGGLWVGAERFVPITRRSKMSSRPLSLGQPSSQKSLFLSVAAVERRAGANIVIPEVKHAHDFSCHRAS